VTHETALERNAKAVSAFLARQTKPLSVSAVARGSRLSTEQTKRVCEALVLAGRAVRSRNLSVKGVSFLYRAAPVAAAEKSY
jgi:hypothetical protein